MNPYELSDQFQLPELAPEQEARHRLRSYLDEATRQIRHMPAIGGRETLDAMKDTAAELTRLVADYVGSPDQVTALTVCAEQLGEQTERFCVQVPKLATAYYVGPIRQAVHAMRSQLADVSPKAATRKAGR